MPEYYYVKEKHEERYEVIPECQNYYYYNDDEEMNFCVNSCKDVDLYFFNGQKKCIEECKKDIVDGGVKYIYYDPTNNECLDICKGRTNFEYSPSITTSSTHQECLSHCPTGSFFDEEKNILSTCDYFVSSSNSQLCVKRCEPNEKVNDNKCVQKCDKYFVRETVTKGGENVEIKKCVNSCSGDNIYLDLKNKECIDYNLCSDDNYYIVGNNCYPKCTENNYFIDSSTYNCLTKCPNDLKNYELLIDENPKIYLCKSTCPTTQFFLDDKCISKCPKEYKYIGNNNKCLQTCVLDPLGEHYYDIKDNSLIDYKIYQCTMTCNIDGTEYFYISGNKECFDVCPDGNQYYIENTKECLQKCPEEFPFYQPDSASPFICKATTFCRTNQYFLDGTCVSINDCKNSGKPFINSKNICLDECKEKYKQKNSDGTYTCLNSCSHYIIGDNNDDLECVLDCPEDKNFIGLNNKCKGICEKEDCLNFYKYKDSDSVTTTSGENYKIYKCMDGCNDYYNLKVDGISECFNTCPNTNPYYPYKSPEEHKCYSNCLDSKMHPYTLTFTDSVSNTIIYECADNCRDPVPNYGENKICRNGCDSLDTNVKDHDGKCVYECDKNTDFKFNSNNECKNQCDGTIRRYSKKDYKCKNKCIGDDIYLLENINENECLSDCRPSEYKKIYTVDIAEEKAFAGEIRCVSTYGDKYYYISDRILRDECNGDDYVVEDTHECVTNCDTISTSNEKYYYYEYEVPSSGESTLYSKYTCVKVCPNDKKYVLENNHCSDNCNLNYRYYLETDYKCILNCPEDYYKEGQKCVERCENYPYVNGDECVLYCDGEKKFFDDNAHIKECLNDCPAESPYFYEEEFTPGITIYRCKGFSLRSCS